MPKIKALLFAFAGILAVSPHTYAQSLPLGSLTTVGPRFPCTNARNGSHFYTGMVCQDATVSCPNTANINLTFGWTGPSTPQGTVALFSGGAGTSPTENDDDIPAYATAYVGTFEVVQFEWSSPWQDPSSDGSGGSFLAAACRPATLLSYLNNSSIRVNSMCAQGNSMGSAALGYSLAWYAANYLKNVELIAGPVLSKTDLGCTSPHLTPVTVCGTGTNYCSPRTTAWTDQVYYVPGEAAAISNWSGLPGANGTGGACARSTVNPAYYPAWQAMSIVDGTSAGATPTFSYPSTFVRGWLCTQSYQTGSCSAPNCPNNTSAQGAMFYNAVSAAEGGSLKLQVTGTLQCLGPEGVFHGTDPDLNESESLAIIADMKANCRN